MTERPIDHLDIDSVFLNARLDSRRGRPALEIVEDIKKSVELAGNPLLSEENLQSFEHFLTVSALSGEENLRTASDFLAKNRNFLIALFKKQKPSDEFIDTLLGFYEGARIVEEIMKRDDIKSLLKELDLQFLQAMNIVIHNFSGYDNHESSELGDLDNQRLAKQLFSLRNIKYCRYSKFIDLEGIKFYLANKAFFDSNISSSISSSHYVSPENEGPIYSLEITSDHSAKSICQYFQRNPKDEIRGFYLYMGHSAYSSEDDINVWNISRRLEQQFGVNEFDEQDGDQDDETFLSPSPVDLQLEEARNMIDFTMPSMIGINKEAFLEQITLNPGKIEFIGGLEIRSIEDVALTRKLLLDNPIIMLDGPIFATIDLSYEDLELFASRTTYFAEFFNATEDYFWCEFFAGTKCLVLGNTQVSSSTFCTIPEKIRENKQLMDYIYSSERYDGKAYFIEDKALELDDDGVVALADKFSDCVGIVVTNQFVQLSKELLDVLPVNLQVLDLSHNEISDEGALLLAKYIKKGKFPKLEQVALHHNFISEKALKKLYKSSKSISWDCVDQLD